MLEVNIEKIVPVTEARDMFNKIIDDVEGTDELYVLTKNGKPASVVVGVNHLEKLTGAASDTVVTQIDDLSAGQSSASDTPFAAATPAPAEEESETVFASADDASPSVPAAATPSPSLTLNEISAQGDTALAEPAAEVAEADLNPSAPSTETTGTANRINPVPAGFGGDYSSPVAPAPMAPSQERPEDQDSTVIPDISTNPTSEDDPFATISPNTSATTQFAEEAPAEEEDADSAASTSPVMPPRVDE